MLLFLDTEFTCLPNPLMPTRLISVGLVSEDGKHEFYGEIRRGEGWEFSDCSDFVMLEVVPQLKGGKFAGSPEELKTRLLAWLESLPADEHTPACDSQIDLDLLLGLLGRDWPARLSRKYLDLRPVLDTDGFDQAFLVCLRERAGSQHNALDDAWGSRAGWMACMPQKR